MLSALDLVLPVNGEGIFRSAKAMDQMGDFGRIGAEMGMKMDCWIAVQPMFQITLR